MCSAWSQNRKHKRVLRSKLGVLGRVRVGNRRSTSSTTVAPAGDQSPVRERFTSEAASTSRNHQHSAFSWFKHEASRKSVREKDRRCHTAKRFFNQRVYYTIKRSRQDSNKRSQMHTYPWEGGYQRRRTSCFRLKHCWQQGAENTSQHNAWIPQGNKINAHKKNKA